LVRKAQLFAGHKLVYSNMIVTVVNTLALILGVYFLVGVLFGIYFVALGAKKIDPLMHDSKFSVRLLLLPGAIGLWPFLLIKLFKK